MPRILVYFLILISAFRSQCQTSERSFYGGGCIKSTGFGVAYQSKFETQNKLGKQFDLDLTTYHHAQETKSFNTEANYPSPYVFGKLNKVALLRAGYAYSYTISKFTDAQRIGIDLIVGAGVSLAFLKPVYLNIIYPDAAGYDIVVSEKYNPVKHHDKSKIAGYSDSRVGMNEMDYKGGLFARVGLGFVWGYFTNFPKRLEIGIHSEFFKHGLPVMGTLKNKSLINGVYLKCFIGKRVAKN